LQRIYGTAWPTREALGHHLDLLAEAAHLPYYTDDMYPPIETEGEKYYLRPMNCPHHHLVYKARPHSYRDLPVKLAEYGTVYRLERSGQLHGLLRPRGFTQNDGHVYCTYEQAKDQFLEAMRMHADYYQALGITGFYMVLALRDPANIEKYHDDAGMWQTAERITREAMDESGIPYVEEPGGAADGVHRAGHRTGAQQKPGRGRAPGAPVTFLSSRVLNWDDSFP
jgi:threonyl-tRNA synthetase